MIDTYIPPQVADADQIPLFPVRSELSSVKDDAGSMKVETVLEEVAKLRQLRALDLPETVFRTAPPKLVTHYRQRAGSGNALSESGIVDEVEDMKRPQDVVQLPESLLGLVLPGVGAELADDGGLGNVPLRKRSHDALDIWPFLDDQSVKGPSDRLDELAGMMRLSRRRA